MFHNIAVQGPPVAVEILNVPLVRGLFRGGERRQESLNAAICGERQERMMKTHKDKSIDSCNQYYLQVRKKGSGHGVKFERRIGTKTRKSIWDTENSMEEGGEE